MEGCLIGSLTKDASIADEPTFVNSTSTCFRLSLEKLTAKLLPALSLLGASDQWLSDYIDGGYKKMEKSTWWHRYAHEKCW